MLLTPDSFWKPGRRHRALVVLAGRLWATSSDGCTDHIVEAGERLELKGRGWLCQALGGTPCNFIPSTCSPTAATREILSRSSSKRAG